MYPYCLLQYIIGSLFLTKSTLLSCCLLQKCYKSFSDFFLSLLLLGLFMIDLVYFILCCSHWMSFLWHKHLPRWLSGESYLVSPCKINFGLGRISVGSSWWWRYFLWYHNATNPNHLLSLKIEFWILCKICILPLFKSKNIPTNLKKRQVHPQTQTLLLSPNSIAMLTFIT